MKRPLIRAALFLYPASWRRRYGGELEQMLHDCGADADRSLTGSAWLLIELSGAGLLQRARSSALATRMALVACLCAAAAIGIDASTLTPSTSQGIPISFYNDITLAPSAPLPVGLLRVHKPGYDFPVGWDPLPKRTTVWFFRGTSKVLGISGPPASVVIDPRSDQVTSVTYKPTAGGV